MLLDQLQLGTLLMATTALAETEALAIVEDIRDMVRALDFEPLDDQALAEMYAETEDAVEDAESEGVHRTGRLAALHQMLIQERAPQDVRDLAVQRFMEAIASEAKPAIARSAS